MIILNNKKEAVCNLVSEFIQLWIPYIITCYKTETDRTRAAMAWTKTLMEMGWICTAYYTDESRTFEVVF